jgi:hypothetical protein
MRRISALSAALVAGLALAVPTIASGDEVRAAATVKVVDLFDDLGTVAEDSGLDVLFPERINTNGISPGKIFGNGSAEEGTYSLNVGVGKECNGSNACFVAWFYAEKGGKRAYRTKVKLTGGKTGYFKPVTCGASCSPAAIQWKQGGALYEIQYKGASEKKEKATMIKLANSAIKAGPRQPVGDRTL